MPSFKSCRVPTHGNKFKLSKIDPRRTPFAKGSQEQQKEQLDGLQSWLAHAKLRLAPDR